MSDGELYFHTFSLDRKGIDPKAPPILLIVTLTKSYSSSLVTKKEYAKRNKKVLIKRPCSVCSLTIHLSLSWVNTRCVRKRLLRAVTTTSKTRHTLQEEYEILIKLVRLWIGSPQLQRWELYCSQHRRLTPGLPATLRRASSHFFSKWH